MYTVNEIMQFVNENDVKFIRLSFCDLAGNLKNISVMPCNLERIFNSGQSFDASPLFSGESKLKLAPDPSTLMAMPWRPSSGRVIRFFCDLLDLDGKHFKGDYRYILKQLKSADKLEIECKCPFYLFRMDENGYPTSTVWDKGGYFDVSPFDRGENIRRELCLSLDEMKIPVLASFHGENAGQNVVMLKAESLLQAADYMIAFKFASQAIALRNGLYASFDKCPNGNKNRFSLSIDNKEFVFDASLNPYIELKKVQLD